MSSRPISVALALGSIGVALSCLRSDQEVSSQLGLKNSQVWATPAHVNPGAEDANQGAQLRKDAGPQMVQASESARSSATDELMQLVERAVNEGGNKEAVKSSKTIRTWPPGFPGMSGPPPGFPMPGNPPSGFPAFGHRVPGPIGTGSTRSGYSGLPLNLSAGGPAFGKSSQPDLEKIDFHIQMQSSFTSDPSGMIPLYREKLKILTRLRGEHSWKTGDVRRQLDTFEWLARQPRDVQLRHHEMVQQSLGGARMGSLWGDFQKVARVLRDALEMQQEVFGEDHFLTAAASRELAAALGTMGKYTEAEALQRRALAIALRVLEEDHPLIGASYLNLAAALRRLGMYAEAAAMQRSALAFNLKSLGENHHETARSYNELAQSLQAHEQFSEAESTFRRVLAIRLKAMEERDKALEEGDLDKAFGDANRVIPPLFRHLYAVPPPSSVHGPRMNAEIARLRTAGMHAEAERLEAQGELDPTIAGCYHELAGVLAALGKHVEAEAKYRRALEIRLKLFGVNSPIGVQLSTAASYDGLGRFLQAHDNSAEAESLHRRALEIHRKVFGDDHPHTAISYRSLAGSLERQGRQAEALVVWDAAAASYDKARILGAKGLESALQRLPSPLPGFAVALAIAGKPREAWLQWEKGLARSVFDEVSRRATRPLTPREHEEEAKLLGQAHEIDERLGRLREVYMPAQQYEASRRELEQQANDVRRRLLELELQFETKYGAVVGQPAPIQSVQQALDVGTAVVGWIDEEPNHWACLLRHTGDPVWVRLLGSGQDGAWSEEDTSLATRLRAELDPDTSTGNAKPLAEALARQRLEPIKVHLKGIQRLVVVNSPGIAGVPLEVLMWSQPDPAWARMTVCYAPSASMFVYLVARPSVRDRAPTLLAVGDPAYPESGRDNSAPPEPPDSGIAIVSVLPNGNAALHGLRGGDVLLTYAGKVPEKPEDLMFDAPETGPRRVPVRYWRDGITRAIDVAAGPLDVTLDYRPIGEVVLARRTASNILRGERRESNYRRLDGTRREVEAIAQLFPQYRVTTILGEKALESTVQNLARFGGLKAFRFLHFAAHGESDPHHAFRTALILLPDPERPGAFSQGADGRITAEQIVRTWELDADLVVLSACESALGLHVGSEGYLGFAQPLFAKGARSVVLSQWKVDDQATSLLMTRFYENLLGRRKGVNRPMPKARALHEARMWLRELTVDRVQQLTRSDPHKAQSARGPTPIRPFEHPSHWASFILIGDSN